MSCFPPTLILRHRRENLKKCSLRGLETRSDFRFFRYPLDPLPSLENYILLKPGGSPLSEKDSPRGLFLIDATWRLAAIVEKQLIAPLETRSLPPSLKTAYPRRQTHCLLPEEGLASVEALYAAYLILRRSPLGLLNGYHWKNEFVEKNSLALF